MKTKIQIEGKEVTINYDGIEDAVNVSEILNINSSNILGELVMSAIDMNKVGIMRASLNAALSESNLRLKAYEATARALKRKEAANNGGKFFIDVEGEQVPVKATETALATCYQTESKWIDLKHDAIQAQKEFEYMDSLYWSANDRSKKLNLLHSTSPEEFTGDIIEKKLNEVSQARSLGGPKDGKGGINDK